MNKDHSNREIGFQWNKMKIIKSILPVVILMAFSFSCKKEKIITTKHVTDSLLIEYSTLTLYPTKDASIFYSDGIDSIINLHQFLKIIIKNTVRQ